MQNVTIVPSKVDLALEALAKLSTEDRKTILEGVKEIVASYATVNTSSSDSEKGILTGWWL
jgi:hypothetical protein